MESDWRSGCPFWASKGGSRTTADGWRHRFKTVAKSVRMDPEVRDAIQGHAPKTEGEAYGEWPLDALRAEVEKLVRYPEGS